MGVLDASLIRTEQIKKSRLLDDEVSALEKKINVLDKQAKNYADTYKKMSDDLAALKAQTNEAWYVPTSIETSNIALLNSLGEMANDVLVDAERIRTELAGFVRDMKNDTKAYNGDYDDIKDVLDDIAKEVEDLIENELKDAWSNKKKVKYVEKKKRELGDFLLALAEQAKKCPYLENVMKLCEKSDDNHYIKGSLKKSPTT